MKSFMKKAFDRLLCWKKKPAENTDTSSCIVMYADPRDSVSSNAPFDAFNTLDTLDTLDASSYPLDAYRGHVRKALRYGVPIILQSLSMPARIVQLAASELFPLRHDYLAAITDPEVADIVIDDAISRAAISLGAMSALSDSVMRDVDASGVWKTTNIKTIPFEGPTLHRVLTICTAACCSCTLMQCRTSYMAS
jgi:hypothetical protein